MILVGHEPWLSQFLVAALAGMDARFAIEFKKGGAACIEFVRRALNPAAPRSDGCCRRGCCAHCASRAVAGYGIGVTTK